MKGKDISIDTLGAEPRVYSFDIAMDDATAELGERGCPEFGVKAPVHIEVSARRNRSDIYLAGTFSTVLAAGCVRCLEPFELPLKGEFELTLTKGRVEPKLSDDHPEVELSAADLETEHIEGDVIDLASLAFDELVLALPDYPLCSEECKGLCPECGAALDSGECKCPEGGPVDPRLAVLAKLKK